MTRMRARETFIDYSNFAPGKDGLAAPSSRTRPLHFSTCTHIFCAGDAITRTASAYTCTASRVKTRRNGQIAHSGSKRQRKGIGCRTLIYPGDISILFVFSLFRQPFHTGRHGRCRPRGSPSYFCLHTPVRASAKASHGNDVAAAAAVADIFILFDVELIPYKYSSMRMRACLRDTRTCCALLMPRFESRMIFCLSSRICRHRVDNDKFETTRQLSAFRERELHSPLK